jgi:hypothetical protein
MGATRYTLRLADGSIVTGSIHGAGGLVGGGENNAQRIRSQIDRASKGWPLGIYEPAPGHCSMYDDGDSFDNWRRVDLRGAELLKQEAK